MIRVLIPKVPTAEALLPYLRMIDESRWYANFGPLVCRLEERLAERFGAHVVTTSSCTLGLELAFELYRSMGLSEITVSPLTFQATALAARRAGLKVAFRDPDPETWSDGTVAAFGLPAWRGPIVDAAAAFGEQRVTKDILAVFSLHATKTISAGEGGFVVTHDRGEAEEIRQMTNFGFLSGTRVLKYNLGHGVSRGPGTNAKLSEYHAAVALASLDAWDGTGPPEPSEELGIQTQWLRLFDWYDDMLPKAVVRQKRARGIYPVLAVKLPCEVEPVMKSMARFGIETRRWYVPPLYRHPLFLDDREKYPVSEDLSRHLIGLPYHLFLTEDEVAFVCERLFESIAENSV